MCWLIAAAVLAELEQRLGAAALYVQLTATPPPQFAAFDGAYKRVCACVQSAIGSRIAASAALPVHAGADAVGCACADGWALCAGGQVGFGACMPSWSTPTCRRAPDCSLTPSRATLHSCRTTVSATHPSSLRPTRRMLLVNSRHVVHHCTQGRHRCSAQTPGSGARDRPQDPL